MKKIFYYTALCLVIVAGSSCSKVDNYKAPSSTISGSVIDEATGQTLQTEVGGRGTRIELLETSYSANPQPIYLESMQDGTFNNNKMFDATYKAIPQGAFVPLVVTDDAGNTVTDSSKSFVLKGSATLNFKVQPLLRIQLVGSPVFNADSTVTVQFKIARGTKDPGYQQPIADVNLYVCNTHYADENNYDVRYSPTVHFDPGDLHAAVKQDSLLSNTLTLTTINKALPLQDVYFRVAARISVGLNEYNYSIPVSIKYP
jgi:Protein of unknown function (DUF3823) N-terminal domain/Domain of unknown function (DUF3823_C)